MKKPHQRFKHNLGQSVRLFLFTVVCITNFVSINSQAETIVSVGAYVHDIQNLEYKNHAYTIDVYIWFRWKNPQLNPAENLEFSNPSDLWAHMRTNEYEKPEPLSNGEFYQVIHHIGRFSKKFDLTDYPFDHQTLTLEFEDKNFARDGVRFVSDEVDTISINPKLKLPGFKIGEPRLEILDHLYPTRFGDPRTERNLTFSRVSIQIPISRPIFTYSVKLLLPIVCVILCAALMFLFKPHYVDARVGIGITALLTIVALQITLNEDLPEIDYLVLIDKVYLGAYIFVILGLGVIVKSTWMLDQGNPTRAIRLNEVSLIVLTTLYVVTMSVLIGWSLLF